MTYSLDLHFLKQKKEFPGPSIAHIVINACTRDDKDRIFISHDCLSIRDFELEVKRLHKELDDIL